MICKQSDLVLRTNKAKSEKVPTKRTSRSTQSQPQEVTDELTYRFDTLTTD